MNIWKFGIDNDYLISLVLKGKKTATTSNYDINDLSQVGDRSIITYDNGNDACLIETKKVIITEFKNITWELAILEGENNSLEEWREVHNKFFKSYNKDFNDDTKVVFEIFEVIEKY